MQFYKKVKFTGVFVFFLLGMLMMHAQYVPKQRFSRAKVRYGARLNFDASGSSQGFGLSPAILYKVNEQWDLGGGLSFGYADDAAADAHTYHYGLSVLANYYPTVKWQFSAELEEMIVHTKAVSFYSEESLRYVYGLPALYLGLGFKVTKSVMVGGRYDVLYNNDRRLYTSSFTPFVQVFFNAGRCCF